jgi:hypothetical protein
MHLNMTSRINFNYYLFCMQQLSKKEQPFWSEEDLASFRNTVNQYQYQKQIPLNDKDKEYNMKDLLVIPKLERTITVETPFLENELTGEISDLSGRILATYHSQEERRQMYAILIKKYENTCANKVHT